MVFRLPAQFCLDLVTAGMLEVWVGPLTGGRFAVSLYNRCARVVVIVCLCFCSQVNSTRVVCRSPGADVIVLDWSMLGVSASSSFAVRDIWAAKDVGTFAGSYKVCVCVCLPFLRMYVFAAACLFTFVFLPVVV